MLKVTIKIGLKDQVEDLPDNAVDWEQSTACIDLDKVDGFYDCKEDGVKILGNSYDFNTEQYTLDELIMFKIGRKELPKINGCNANGSLDAVSNDESQIQMQDDFVTSDDYKCKLCGTYMSLDVETGVLNCQICGPQRKQEE